MMGDFSSTIGTLTEDMQTTSLQSNQSSFTLFLSNYKIHHILFKSTAYSSVVNGTVTEDLKKDYKSCSFGIWYHGTGEKLFGTNSIFKKMHEHHKLFHSLINENLDCALSGGCVAKEKSKEQIMKRFQDAEEHSNKLFALMDTLAIEVGKDIDMGEVIK